MGSKEVMDKFKITIKCNKCKSEDIKVFQAGYDAEVLIICANCGSEEDDMYSIYTSWDEREFYKIREEKQKERNNK